MLAPEVEAGVSEGTRDVLVDEEDGGDGGEIMRAFLLRSVFSDVEAGVSEGTGDVLVSGGTPDADGEILRRCFFSL